MPSHRRTCLIVVALALAVSAGALVLPGIESKAWRRTPQEEAGPAATTAGPEPGWVAGTGKIEALRQAEVRAAVLGRVGRYLKEEGDSAREGEPVVELESGLERAALREAQALLRQAEQHLARLAGLNRQGVVSDQEKDDAESAVALAQARLDKAADALGRMTLRAPFSGRVLRTYLEAGEIAAPQGGQALFVLGDQRGLILRAEIDELDAGRLRPGARALARPDAFPGREFPGRVRRVAGMLGRRTLASDDPAERADGKVLEVEILLSPDPALKPGMTAQARVEAR